MFNGELALVQVMAWCRQVTSQCLGQYLPSSISPYGVTRPQWVNVYVPQQIYSNFTDDYFRRIGLNNDIYILTHWQSVTLNVLKYRCHYSRNFGKMATILQTALWNAFCWMKIIITWQVPLLWHHNDMNHHCFMICTQTWDEHLATWIRIANSGTTFEASQWAL